MEEYLSTLPSDLAHLSSRSTAASSLALDTVDSIIARLELARAQLTSPAQREGNPADTLLPLSSFVRTGGDKVNKGNKEWSAAVTRFAKAVDKKFTGPPQPLFPSPTPPPPSTGTTPSASLDPSLLYLTSSTLSPTPSAPSTTASTAPFSSPQAIASLNQTIALHLARIGAFDSLESFLEESGTPPLDAGLLGGLRELHAILQELRNGVCTRALEWVEQHPEHGAGGGAGAGAVAEGDDLEFALRKEEFIRLLLAGSDLSSETDSLLPSPSASAGVNPHVQQALAYGGEHFRRLHTPARKDLISALLTSAIYMPFPRLLSSPYASLYAPYLAPSSHSAAGGGGAIETSPLCATFAARFLETLGLPRESALSVVSDIGGGGAMAKILKVRSVMKEKKTEWSAVGELPVEIPLPSNRRYHSIFACPVSKEQSTFTNPPMLLPCGHVIARESLARLARGTPQLKCPYCPVVSRVAEAVRVHF